MKAHRSEQYLKITLQKVSGCKRRFREVVRAALCKKAIFLSDLELHFLFPSCVLKSHLTPTEDTLPIPFTLKKKVNEFRRGPRPFPKSKHILIREMRKFFITDLSREAQRREKGRRKELISNNLHRRWRRDQRVRFYRLSWEKLIYNAPIKQKKIQQ